jgi:rhomboid protease GluP
VLKTLLSLFEKIFYILKYPRQDSKENIGEFATLSLEKEIDALPHEERAVEADEWDGNIEDFEPAPPKKPSFFEKIPPVRNMYPASGLVILWLILSFYQWSRSGWNGEVSQKSLFLDREYWRLGTALFVHKDMGHLLSNTPLFLVFGYFLRGFFGIFVFPVAALIAGILANYCTILFYPPDVRLLGASGMVYAMVAMWIVFYLQFEIGLKWRIRVLRALGVSLLLLFPTTFQPEVSYLAHGFGFVMGLLIGLILVPIIQKSLLAHRANRVELQNVEH